MGPNDPLGGSRRSRPRISSSLAAARIAALTRVDLAVASAEHDGTNAAGAAAEAGNIPVRHRGSFSADNGAGNGEEGAMRGTAIGSRSMIATGRLGSHHVSTRDVRPSTLEEVRRPSTAEAGGLSVGAAAASAGADLNIGERARSTLPYLDYSSTGLFDVFLFLLHMHSGS